MSKYKTVKVWNKVFGNRETVFDYAGREMRKSACGDPHSAYHPTLDHIRPLSLGGSDVAGNIVICHRDTNAEKADKIPTLENKQPAVSRRSHKGHTHGLRDHQAVKGRIVCRSIVSTMIPANMKISKETVSASTKANMCITGTTVSIAVKRRKPKKNAAGMKKIDK